jgi:hypothetical protein
MRAMPRSRRRLLWAGVALLLLVVLVLIPGLYASQPGFVTRYPALSAQYKAWSTSKHKDVACESCHAQPTFLGRAGYSAWMLGEFYRSVFSSAATPGVFAAPTNASCQVCHAKLVTTSPTGDLIIPHKAHVDVLKMQCVTCHRYLVHELSPKGTHTPPMAACLTCHNGVQAKNACVTCHTAKAAPETHKAANWLVIHPAQAVGGNCPTCHAWTKNWCADCHSRRPPSHVATWRTTHPAAVKTHRDCEVCHTGPFCIRCHGVVPQLDFNPAVTLVTQ